jgi:hypothetical protein
VRRRLHHSEQPGADAHAPEVRRGLGGDTLLEGAFVGYGHAVGGAVDPEHRIAVQESPVTARKGEWTGAVAYAALGFSWIRTTPPHVRAEPLLTQQPAGRHRGDQAPAR